MVCRLGSPLQNPSPAARVPGRLGEHFGKNGFTDVMRTGTCNKDTARPEQAHGAVVDLFVATEGAFQALLVFGEGGRVQDDGVVAPAFPVALREKIEGIRLDALDIRE